MAAHMLLNSMLMLPLLYAVVHSLQVAGPKGQPSDMWLMKGTMTSSGARSTATRFGFTVVSEKFPGYFILKQAESGPMPMTSENLKKTMMSTEPKVSDLKQLWYKDHVLRGVPNQQARRQSQRTITITDSNWADMWHASEGQYPNLGVYAAWTQGYTGAGIHVTVIDDGVEPDHPDLVNNYLPEFGFNFLENDVYVNHTGSESHGTLCAGIISATKNDQCVLGMAYDSTFSSVKIFNNDFGLDDLGEALALTYNLELTDIYSNSWGPSDSGSIFGGMGELASSALKQAVTEGRNGKGAIYTWAAGNGGSDDDCNADAYAGSIYTISVTAVGPDQGISWYSEQCSSVFVGAYSGDSPDLRIATTTINQGCTTGFQGTSASCPVGAGVIALALQANPDLTWRDVQHLIVETATTQGLIMGEWNTNGAGKQVSHSFGFGLLNAEGMVQRARTWEMVPGQVVCSSNPMVVRRTPNTGDAIVQTFSTDACGIRYVEHVEVWANFGAGPRGALQISLTSPQGTKSRLLRPRRFDFNPNMTEWTFMTVHNWGENPAGVWTLMLEVIHSSVEFQLESWQITVYGTQTLPESLTGPQPKTEDDGLNVAAVVGGSVGGVAGVGAIVGVTYYFLSRPKVAPAV